MKKSIILMQLCTMLTLQGCVTPDYSRCQQFGSEHVRYQCERDESERVRQANQRMGEGMNQMFSSGATSVSQNESIRCVTRETYYGTYETICK